MIFQDKIMHTIEDPNQWKSLYKSSISPVNTPHPDGYGIIMGPPLQANGIGHLECLETSKSIFAKFNTELPPILQAISLLHWHCIFGIAVKPFGTYWMLRLYAVNQTYPNALLQTATNNGHPVTFNHMGVQCIITPHPNTKQKITEIINLHKELDDKPSKKWRSIMVDGFKNNLDWNNLQQLTN
eukprot:5944048-Ditylum_brightwellii.AAC.1